MKKMLSLPLCLMLSVAGACVAAAADKGGFSPAAGGGFAGPGPAVSSAKDAASMWDDSHVSLCGSIVQHLGKNDYLFKDASGTIRVEIDGDKWQGQSVAPGDTVELYGEIDKDWNSVKVDVDRVVKLP